MNKFQKKVIKITNKRLKEEYEAFKKIYGSLFDYVKFKEINVKELPLKKLSIEYIDKEKALAWHDGATQLSSKYKMIKIVKKELKQKKKIL